MVTKLEKKTSGCIRKLLHLLQEAEDANTSADKFSSISIPQVLPKHSYTHKKLLESMVEEGDKESI